MYTAADFTWTTFQAPLPSGCFLGIMLFTLGADSSDLPSIKRWKPFVALVTLHNLLLVARLKHRRGYYVARICRRNFHRQASSFGEGRNNVPVLRLQDRQMDKDLRAWNSVESGEIGRASSIVSEITEPAQLAGSGPDISGMAPTDTSRWFREKGGKKSAPCVKEGEQTQVTSGQSRKSTKKKVGK